MHTSLSNETEITMATFSGSRSCHDISRQLFHLFDKSNEPWSIKDSSFTFVYVNQSYVDFLQIPQEIARNITEFSYEDIPPLVSFKDKLVTHDRKVVESGQRMFEAQLQSVEPNIADLANGWLKSYRLDYKLGFKPRLNIHSILLFKNCPTSKRGAKQKKPRLKSKN